MAHHKPEALDDVCLEGEHYFLAKRNGKWAVKVDNIWKEITDEWVWDYLGPDKSGIGTSKWNLHKADDTPDTKTVHQPSSPPNHLNRTPQSPKVGDQPRRVGPQTYVVTIRLNAHVEVTEVRAITDDQAKRLALDKMAHKLNLSVAELRNRINENEIELRYKD